MSKKFQAAVFITALLGGVLSFFSTQHFLRIQKSGFEEASYCAVNDVINCDLVSASSYATLLDIPVAWWGFLFYVSILTLLAWYLFIQKDREEPLALAWILSLAAVVVSLRMAFVLFFNLRLVCLECIGMYLANVLLFLLLTFFWGKRLKNIFGFFPRLVAPGILVLCLFGIGALVMRRVDTIETPFGRVRISVEEKVNAYNVGSLYPVKIDEAWPVWGNPQAPVVIVEFSDFECPFCAKAAKHLKFYLREFRDKIQLRYVNFPIDPLCNTSVQGGHRHACLAAYAAVCGQARDDFWGFHDALFSMQQQLSRESILELAQKRGWNGEEFFACLNDPATQKRVTDDIATARGLYVSGTPFILINGRNMRYWLDGRALQAVVRQELAK